MDRQCRRRPRSRHPSGRPLKWFRFPVGDWAVAGAGVAPSHVLIDGFVCSSPARQLHLNPICCRRGSRGATAGSPTIRSALAAGDRRRLREPGKMERCDHRPQAGRGRSRRCRRGQGEDWLIAGARRGGVRGSSRWCSRCAAGRQLALPAVLAAAGRAKVLGDGSASQELVEERFYRLEPGGEPAPPGAAMRGRIEHGEEQGQPSTWSAFQ